MIDDIELLSYDMDGKTPATPRPICIKHADPAEALLMADMSSQPTITIRVVCSKGTYIRALARDIGEALGSGAYLTSLVRTRVGEYKLQDALDISDFEKVVESEALLKG